MYILYHYSPRRTNIVTSSFSNTHYCNISCISLVDPTLLEISVFTSLLAIIFVLVSLKSLIR